MAVRIVAEFIMTGKGWILSSPYTIAAEAEHTRSFNCCRPKPRPSSWQRTLPRKLVHSSLIAGETIRFETVLTSLLRKLDPEIRTKAKSDRNAETTAELILDATNSNHMIF